MGDGSPVRVRYIAEWVEARGAGPELTVGDRVVCPQDEMVVRAVSPNSGRPAAGSSADEVAVWVAPSLFAAGSAFRVRCEVPGRPVRWPSGSVYSDPARVLLDETRPTLEEALDAVAEFADERVVVPSSHTTRGARVTLVALEPGEEGSGRALIRLKVGEEGLESLSDALERLCVEAERRFGQDANQPLPAGAAGSGRVRFVTEWVENAASRPEFTEGDRVALPARALVVRRVGNEAQVGDPLRTWWVSTEAAPTRSIGLGLDLPSPLRRGDVLVAEVGRGLVDPGSALRIEGSARAGGASWREKAQHLDLTVPTVGAALDAVAEWAGVVVAWAGDVPDRVERLAGHVKLYALEDGHDYGRQLVAAGIGSAEGLDAFLDMLEAFCVATERRYGAVDLAVKGRGAEGAA